MTLPSSGTLTINQIRTEMNTSSGSLRTLSSLAGFSTPDPMSEFYGFSNYYRPNLISYTDPYVTNNYGPNITSATIYSSYNGGTRAANITIQYSDDNVTYYTAWSGVMSNNASCGIVTITGGGGVGSHRYWRYVEGSAVTAHHPRTSRITLGDNLGRSWTIARYTTDNCSDQGAYQIGTVMYDFLYSIPDLTSISSGNQCSFNGISYSSGNLVMPGGGGNYGGYGNLGTWPTTGTIQFWFYPTVVANYRNYFCTHNNQGNIGIRFELYDNGTSNMVVANDSSSYSDFSVGSFSVNTWYNMAVTWNTSSGSVKVYKNNSLIVNSTTSNWASSLANVATGIGYSFGAERNMSGNFGPLFIYNAELTANQVQQNWITTKSRYGY